MPKYRSKFEKVFAKELNKKGLEFRYESKRLTYIKTHYYIPDFELNGFFIETKGRFTAADRRKLIAVCDANDGIDIRLIFMRDQPLYKGSRTYYSDWATKHGFKFAFNRIPKSWVREAKRNGKTRD